MPSHLHAFRTCFGHKHTALSLAIEFTPTMADAHFDLSHDGPSLRRTGRHTIVHGHFCPANGPGCPINILYDEKARDSSAGTTTVT
jgi:hypothetical protein